MGCLQVDFANKVRIEIWFYMFYDIYLFIYGQLVGGGVLAKGCAQGEILFFMCPVGQSSFYRNVG